MLWPTSLMAHLFLTLWSYLSCVFNGTGVLSQLKLLNPDSYLNKCAAMLVQNVGSEECKSVV